MDKTHWTVEISPEIETWYAKLRSKDKAMADRAFDRLAAHGPAVRMPHARSLSGGLYELRFACDGTARRITCYFNIPRRVITLTTFRKQRQSERREVARARQAMSDSKQPGGSNG